MKRILPEEKMSWQRPVLSISNEGAAIKGNRYIVGETPTGIFSGLTTDNIAWYDGIQWQEDIPEEGWVLYDANQTELLIYMNGPSGDYWYYFKDIFATETGLVGTKEVDEINIADTKILEYDSTSDKLIYVAKPTGGGTGFFNKLDATTNPTVNDDLVDGYEVGSLWFNVTTSKVFQCLNATTGAAVWVELTGSGGTGFGSLLTYATLDDMTADTVSLTVGDYIKVTALPGTRFLMLDILTQLTKLWSITSNTIAYWLLKSNSNDSTTNTLNGSDTAMSYSGNEATFNGTTSKIVIADNNLLSPSGSFTLSIWVNVNTYYDNYNGWFSKWVETGNLREFTLCENTGSTIAFILSGDGATAVTASYTRPATGVWTNIIAVFSSGVNIKLYTNGVLRTTVATTITSVTNGTAPVEFGTGELGGATRFFNGKMKKAIFENRAWTETEVLAYYDAAL